MKEQGGCARFLFGSGALLAALVILRAVTALALWGGLLVFSDPYERLLGLQQAPIT